MKYIAYSDESGSIPKTRLNKRFVVVFVVPNNPRELMNSFKRVKLKYLINKGLSPKTEVKGKDLTDNEIEWFFNNYINRIKLYYAWIDSTTVKEKMLSNSNLTHNFMTSSLIERFYDENICEDSEIDLNIDNVNSGVGSLNSLEDHINLTYFQENPSLHVNVQYWDSKVHSLIQFTDIMSNYVYRQIWRSNFPSGPNISERKIY